MALTYDGMPCSLCGKPIDDASQNIFAMTMWGIEDLRFAHLDDNACHQSCIDNWKHRDAFIDFHNRELKDELYIDKHGHVAYRFDYFNSILGGIAMFIGLTLCGPPLALLEIRWRSTVARTIVFTCPYVILLAVFVACAYTSSIATAAWVGGVFWLSATVFAVVAAVYLPEIIPNRGDNKGLQTKPSISRFDQR